MIVVAHHPGDLHALTGREGMFRTAEELAASLDPGAWKIIVAGHVIRSAENTDGRPAAVRDTVLRAVRVADTGLRSRNAGAGPDRATVT